MTRERCAFAQGARGVWLIAAGECGSLICVKRIARAALDILKLSLSRDALGEAPPEAPAPSALAGGRLLRAVFAPEPLPMDPPSPPRRRRPLLRWLLAPEPLPRDPEPPARAGKGRLAALFAPEKLDDSDSA